MHPMTVSNLQSAYAGESQAHMRYLIYGDKAEKDGFPNVARLFRAIAWAEQIHATSHFREMRDILGAATTTAGAGFGLGPTAQNLRVAIEGEDFEVAEMYPAYIAVATAQGEKGAERSCDWAWKAEMTHAAAYKAAKAAVEAGQDYGTDQVSVCATCGHIVIGGDAEGHCPICNAPKERYQLFS